MPISNLKPSDEVTLLSVINPVSQGAGSVSTGWMSLADFPSQMATLLVGAMSTGSTVDAKFEQASDSSGTGAKDVSGTAITQLTKAGSDDNKQVVVNLHMDDLDIDNFTHARFTVTVATAASLIAASVQGMRARYAPGTHVASVDEVVG